MVRAFEAPGGCTTLDSPEINISPLATLLSLAGKGPIMPIRVSWEIPKTLRLKEAPSRAWCHQTCPFRGPHCPRGGRVVVINHSEDRDGARRLQQCSEAEPSIQRRPITCELAAPDGRSSLRGLHCPMELSQSCPPFNSVKWQVASAYLHMQMPSYTANASFTVKADLWVPPEYTQL